MSDYLLQHGTRTTPQTEPMRPDQVENSAGGFVWAVDPWTRLRRFLILGSEGGSYYADERTLTKENVTAVKECLALNGPRTVDEIVEISEAGRAPKNDPALFALACAISLGDQKTRALAGKLLPKVARIGTHLYHFVAYAEAMRGWGTVLKRAIADWYGLKTPDELAMQAVKYRQRDGWTHADVLRLARFDTSRYSLELRDVFGFISGNTDHAWVQTEEYGLSRQVNPWTPSEITPKLIEGFLKAQAAGSAKETAALIREYNLPREALLTEHLNDKDVWFALLEQKMPLTALTRNLATMTRLGVLESKEHKALVTDVLSNAEAIHKARLHPMALLIALRTYALGESLRGRHTWHALPDVVDALDAAFYLAFDNVEPTGNAHLLALDVSGSMSSGWVAGAPITPREASTAMALVTLHAEKDVEVMGFSNRFMPLNFSRRQRLDDACRMTERLPFEGTDCAIPMLWALKESKQFDAFITYTDSETWAGTMHPKQALDQYRQRSGINARSVVVGMVSNGFTIADPNDAGMMDVVGFDTAAPGVIADFVAGRL